MEVAELSRAMSVAFQACKVPAADADWTTKTLIDGEVEGAKGHGLVRFAGLLDRVSKGATNPTPDIRVVADTPAACVLDGDNGLGQVVGARAMDIAVEKATSNGVGLVTVRESSHFGRAGDYALRAAHDSMVGVVFSTASPRLVQAPGARRFLGNNPMALAVPGRSHPLLIDISPAATTVGSIRLAKLEGRQLPDGVALDASGNPTTDPHAALDGGMFGVGGHKGWVLALFVELLSGVLSAGATGDQVGPMQDLGRRQRMSHTMLAINVDLLIGVENLFDGLDDMRERLDDAEGGHARLPGDRVARIERTGELDVSDRLASDIVAALNRAGIDHNLSPRS